MTWEIKNFEELTPALLYNILQLRSEVFVVEQNCIYQDLDDLDRISQHLFAHKNNKILAYTRLVPKDEKYPDATSIGRVVVDLNYRNKKLGKELMKRSINHLSSNFPNVPIIISAQCYLDQFYTDLGFEKVGKDYLEDGIPHQKMIFNN